MGNVWMTSATLRPLTTITAPCAPILAPIELPVLRLTCGPSAQELKPVRIISDESSFSLPVDVGTIVLYFCIQVVLRFPRDSSRSGERNIFWWTESRHQLPRPQDWRPELIFKIFNISQSPKTGQARAQYFGNSCIKLQSKPKPSHVLKTDTHGTIFRVRVRGRSAAMHLMICIVVAMFSPVAPMSGLKTDAIAILVTCKLGSLVWCCSPDEWNPSRS
ncbi:hypothetical protein EDB84DRAFT_199094 [Lactarius hengduanensis]|nr:hypothetical protein EDB84DRAFT_199094 [Lactarius hengduanensis]